MSTWPRICGVTLFLIWASSSLSSFSDFQPDGKRRTLPDMVCGAMESHAHSFRRPPRGCCTMKVSRPFADAFSFRIFFDSLFLCTSLSLYSLYFPPIFPSPPPPSAGWSLQTRRVLRIFLSLCLLSALFTYPRGGTRVCPYHGR